MPTTTTTTTTTAAASECQQLVHETIIRLPQFVAGRHYTDLNTVRHNLSIYEQAILDMLVKH